MKWSLLVAGLLHATFMVAELFPWSKPPVLLAYLTQERLASEPFTPNQQRLVSAIVRNAGIYNGIVAAGLLWATWGLWQACNGPFPDVARVMLIGAVVAGVFGIVTLRSWVPALQVLVGVIGLICLRTCP